MLKAVFISHSERDVQEQLQLPLYAFYSTCLNGQCRQVLSIGEKKEATRRWSVSLHTPDRLSEKKWCQHASWVIDTFWLGVKAFQD